MLHWDYRVKADVRQRLLSLECAPNFRQSARLLLASDSSGPKETNEISHRINNRNCANLVLLHQAVRLAHRSRFRNKKLRRHNAHHAADAARRPLVAGDLLQVLKRENSEQVSL